LVTAKGSVTAGATAGTGAPKAGGKECECPDAAAEVCECSDEAGPEHPVNASRAPTDTTTDIVFVRIVRALSRR
jgi:hypothetical protein